MKTTTMDSTAASAVLATILGLAGAGCARPANAPPSTDGVSLAPDEAAAIGEIAYARVAREEGCRARGGMAADVERRMSFARSSTIADLGRGSCKSNIHPQDLEECVTRIRQLPCAVVLETVTTIEPCNLEPLCGVPPEGTL